ncbi:MAG TPA: 23S rRNA (pseudouridine(1915)-N(3))-methyltransferase RlmH [Stellaceae bacterium]|nr:23S rRNA (pseudouridine(1915)-N(3))-methyltransferase RlmH [Stellaceae bacterium]
MRLHIVAVGKLKAGPHAALARHYAERLAWPLAVREVEEKRPLPAAELKEREGALLLAAAPAGAVLIALDEHGRSLTSPAFAQKLAQWRDGGITDLAFVIGGADGLADQVRQKARLVLSLGAMTWPHLLVRGMLLEQLYRAQQILAGHPYHRG